MRIVYCNVTRNIKAVILMLVQLESFYTSINITVYDACVYLAADKHQN